MMMPKKSLRPTRGGAAVSRNQGKNEGFCFAENSRHRLLTRHIERRTAGDRPRCVWRRQPVDRKNTPIAISSAFLCLTFSLREDSVEDIQFAAWWPWYAKYKPEEFAKMAGKLQLYGLKQENPAGVFMSLEGVLAEFDKEGLQQWQDLAEEKSVNISIRGHRFENYFGISLSEAALLQLPEERLQRWFTDAASCTPRRLAMFFDPHSELIPLVIPPEIVMQAAAKCLELKDEELGEVEESPTELAYWC